MAKPSAFDPCASTGERTGSVTVARGHAEELVESEGEGGSVAVKLGVWISNTNNRSAKLSKEQPATVVGPGPDWR
ncbi:hypothetical protein ABZW30_42110 [Kitasatospora sp. NPDC004669]|uniref:hypothetical protein n=1 Tax=Kitasatospora sp. NPDC004669 TaxID=3154555 RepID=UPI0033B23801